MFSFKYQISNPENWHQDMKDQIPVSIHDRSFTMQSVIGKGGGEYYHLQPGLWIESMNFRLNGVLDVEVLPKPVNDAFFITFWLTNAEVKQKFNDRELEFKFDNVSIVLLSSATQTFYNLPKDEDVELFMIWISREWLLESIVSPKNVELSELFEQNSPIYFSENLDYRFKYILGQVDFRSSDKLSLLTNTLQLLNYFFKNLERKNLTNLAALNVHSSDLKQLLKVKDHILTHPLQDISLNLLADMAGMSLSKFKRLFKQVFGSTPYRYWLENKLEIAMEMLQKNEYTVSETGFMIGYSNLSQFSRAFKNQFGYLPSEIKAN